MGSRYEADGRRNLRAAIVAIEQEAREILEYHHPETGETIRLVQDRLPGFDPDK